MTLTEQEIQQVKDIFYIEDGVEFDVYHRFGNNHELGTIDVTANFEPEGGIFKSTIMRGKLIVVVLKQSGQEVTYIGEDGLLTPGLGQ